MNTKVIEDMSLVPYKEKKKKGQYLNYINQYAKLVFFFKYLMKLYYDNTTILEYIFQFFS